MKRSVSVAILWKKGPVKADIEIVRGKLGSIALAKGRGKIRRGSVRQHLPMPCV